MKKAQRQPRTPRAPQSDCVKRSQIASELRQAIGRAEAAAYAYYDQLRADDNWRVEQRVAFEQRLVQEAAEELRQQHGLTADELSDLLVEQSEVEAIQLFTLHPPQ
jgi:hypothetical protein